MVALDSSSFTTSWGINSISMPNFTLNDNVGLVLNDIKEIPSIVSFGARNFSEMKTEVGGDGFTIFNPETQAIGSIGWIRVVENKFGYKAGDYVPYGKYYTAAIIDVRDKVLMDSAVNLEIPSATNYVSEFDNLTLLINNVMEEMGSGYRDIYFPAASYCYAYEPKTNKELAPQFKAHNWWLPSAGELVRLAYYARLITIGTEEDKEDNLFKPLYDLGLLKVLSADYLFTSSEANNQSIMMLVIYQTNVNNKNIIQSSTNYKHNVRRFRPICSF